MAALRSRCGHYIFALSFVLSSFIFSSPNLSRRRLDVCHTCTHRLSANLGCRSETCSTRLAENTGRKKSPSRHHRTTLSACVFATKACNLTARHSSIGHHPNFAALNRGRHLYSAGRGHHILVLNVLTVNFVSAAILVYRFLSTLSRLIKETYLLPHLMTFFSPICQRGAYYTTCLYNASDR